MKEECTCAHLYRDLKKNREYEESKNWECTELEKSVRKFCFRTRKRILYPNDMYIHIDLLYNERWRFYILVFLWSILHPPSLICIETVNGLEHKNGRRRMRWSKKKENIIWKKGNFQIYIFLFIFCLLFKNSWILITGIRIDVENFFPWICSFQIHKINSWSLHQLKFETDWYCFLYRDKKELEQQPKK